MQNIAISIVDDQQLFRQGLASLISNEEGFSMVSESDSGAGFLHDLAELSRKPDIALIDLEMPGMDGMELNQILQRQYPSIKVIIVSVHANARLISRMIESGACAYLLKNSDKAELINAVRTTYKAGFYISHYVLKAMQESAAMKSRTTAQVNAPPVDISIRERQVLQLICQELTAPEIAAQLFISVRTVEGHRNNLLIKTKSRNTAGLVLFALKHRIFIPPFIKFL